MTILGTNEKSFNESCVLSFQQTLDSVELHTFWTCSNLTQNLTLDNLKIDTVGGLCSGTGGPRLARRAAPPSSPRKSLTSPRARLAVPLSGRALRTTTLLSSSFQSVEETTHKNRKRLEREASVRSFV